MRKKLTTYVDEDSIKQLKILAIEKNVSVADILNTLVSDFLNNTDYQNKQIKKGN